MWSSWEDFAYDTTSLVCMIVDILQLVDIFIWKYRGSLGVFLFTHPMNETSNGCCEYVICVWHEAATRVPSLSKIAFQVKRLLLYIEIKKIVYIYMQHINSTLPVGPSFAGYSFTGKMESLYSIFLYLENRYVCSHFLSYQGMLLGICKILLRCYLSSFNSLRRSDAYMRL